jgi:UDP-glucuronate 4-epimerase
MNISLPFDRPAITGATGFLGGHLARALVASGHRPILLARAPRATTLLEGLGDFVSWRGLDLTDLAALEDVLQSAAPTTLFHMAGTLGRQRHENPELSCAEINVAATIRVLVAAQRAGVSRVILMGCAEEYGNHPGPCHEDLELAPSTPYGISRAAANRFALAMHAREGLPVVIVRAFTVYGPAQSKEMFVSQAVTSAVCGTPFAMTHGRQRRDLVFIDDVVRALIAVAEVPAIEGRVLNVGSGVPRPLRDVAQLIWRISESGAELQIGGRPAPASELHDTWADIELSRRLLGWEPRVDLETGLRATITHARAKLGVAASAEARSTSHIVGPEVQTFKMGASDGKLQSHRPGSGA